MENQFETASPLARISQFVLNLPLSLFSYLEDGVGPLLPSHQKVAMVLEMVCIESCVRQDRALDGRPAFSRRAVARAFVAKAVLNLPTTKDLVERLRLDARLRRIVGFVDGVPSESTFSRVFAELCACGIVDSAHQGAVKALLAQEMVFHASIDATSIPARERGPRRKELPEKLVLQARGRKKGQRPGERTKPLSPQEKQVGQSVETLLDDLPCLCDHGMKRGAKGYMDHWKGFKGHASVADDGIPLAFITTSASVHDSLGAIPLVRMTAKRVQAVLYTLMDKAYASTTIASVVEELGQVAIVPTKSSKKGVLPIEIEPYRKHRYKNRTTVERFFSDLKENHGGSFIFVRGGKKVHSHLMMGVLAIFGLRALNL